MNHLSPSLLPANAEDPKTEEHVEALARQARSNRSRQEKASRISAILITVLVHAVGILILTLIIIPALQVDVPQIQAKNLAAVENPVQQETPQATTRSKPSAPSSSARLLTSKSATATVFVPTVEAETTTVDIGTGTSLGLGFGSGGLGTGAGGDVTFFGQRTKAQRVVFIIDVSQSMRVTGALKLAKKELATTLKLLKSGTDYSILFFSGPVWQIGDKISDPGKEVSLSRTITGPDGTRTAWAADGNNQFTWKPKSGRPADLRWFKAGTSTVDEHIKAVNAVPSIAGTDLRHPFEMALKATPKADTIFFLTDAQPHPQARERVKKIVEQATSGTRPVPINCIVMMESQALPHIRVLAQETGGMLSFVGKNGKLKEIIKAK